MALPTADDLSAYLRLDDAEKTAEATLLQQLLTRGRSILELALIVPIDETAITYLDRSNEGVQFRPITVLMFPYRPVGATVVVTDVNGVVVDSATYTVDQQSGFVRAKPGVCFQTGPYTLVGTYGLALMSNFSTIIEPTLGQAIIDFAADLYYRRNPNAHSEQAGDTRTMWDVSRDVMMRVMQPIRTLRLPVGAA